MASGIVASGFDYTTGITRLRHDLISSGTLAILEVGDPLLAVPGVPARLTNIARPVAESRRVGAGEPWAWVEEFSTGRWKRERTAKGGIHAAAPETGITKSFGRYRAPVAFNDHLKANRGRNICAFIVGRLTTNYARTYGGGNAFFGDYNETTGAGSWQIHLRKPGAADAGMTATAYTQATAPNAEGYGYGGTWASGGNMMIPAGGSFSIIIRARDLTTADLTAFLGWGAVSTSGYGLIHYMAGMEDLDTSGRTFAQVRDLVEQWRQREVVTAGGRYYGDTWTTPATLAAT